MIKKILSIAIEKEKVLTKIIHICLMGLIAFIYILMLMPAKSALSVMEYVKFPWLLGMMGLALIVVYIYDRLRNPNLRKVRMAQMANLLISTILIFAGFLVLSLCIYRIGFWDSSSLALVTTLSLAVMFYGFRQASNAANAIAKDETP